MMNSTIPSPILEQGTEFLTAIVEWAHNLPCMVWSDLAQEAAQGRVALFSVDMINGFCHEGALSSPRVQSIIPAVVDAFIGAYAIGVRNFIVAQDCHSPESVEFADFPPHCLAGTSEAENIQSLHRCDKELAQCLSWNATEWMAGRAPRFEHRRCHR